MPSKLLLESLTINLNDNNNGNNSAIRQALVIIEHKIRNLEKRKTKLESYRAIQASGKELSNDQKAAVAKFDEVAQSLECTRDLSKQFLQLATASEREEKKKARKDATARAQAETLKIREVLGIQNILVAFEEESVRNDFVNGSNGAIKLEESDIEHLSTFCIETQVSRQGIAYEESFDDRALKASEHLSLTIDGRPKAFGSTTYEYMKELLQKIQDCGYLDSVGKSLDDSAVSADESNDAVLNEQSDNPDMETESNEPSAEIGDIPSDAENSTNPDEQQQKMSLNSVKSGHDLPIFEAPSPAAVPAPAFPHKQQPQQVMITQQPQIQQIPQQMHRQPQQIPINNPINVPTQIPPQPNQQQAQVITGVAGGGAPPQQNPLHPGHYPPTTVRAVESLFRQRQYIQQQQIRPIADVIGGGKFFFIQDSEIDSPEMLIGVPVAPPVGFPIPQNLEGQQQNSVAVTLPAPSPTQILPTSMPPQKQALPQQQQQQQQNLVAATIPTQTFTNQSFPPIVPQQSQAIYSTIPQQTVVQGVAVNDLQLGQQITAQQHKQQQPQLVPVFSTQQIPGLPPQLIPATVVHHPQQQQIQGLTKQQQRSHKQNSAGTGSTLINAPIVSSLSAVDAQQQAAAISALQQKVGNLQPPGVVPPNAQLNVFSSGKYPPATVQQQQNKPGSTVSSNHNVNSGGGNGNHAVSVHSNQLVANQDNNNYDPARMIEQKVQKIDLKQPISMKDVSSGSTNDWETDAKIRRSGGGNDRQHKPSHHNSSHHSHHHNSSHLHSSSSEATPSQNENNNTNNNGSGNGGGESNQWSNEMHTNSQQQSTGTSTNPGTNNKSNDWSSTFDNNQTESNHWNNNDAGYNNNNRGNGSGGRQSFNGRNRGIRGGNGTNNGGPTSNGYRGRSNYSSGTSSAQQSNGGSRNNNGVYFRNNDNGYYQNGGGYNGASKDRNNRYSGGENGGSARGPPNSVGGGPQSRTNQNRSNLGGGGGGMGPRGSASGGNRNSTGNGGYNNRPPRQQDLGTVADM